MRYEFNLVRQQVALPLPWDASMLAQVRRVSIVGVPSSAASYAAGQDLAPAALRSADLPEQLIGSGLEVYDDGDLPHQVWRPDRDHPLAQNAGQATASLQQLADRLEPLLARGDLALVLGGNCTIVLGVMAALQRLGAGAPGLLYVDRHYDINTPQSTIDGALDWMGLAHALACPVAWTPSPTRLGPGRYLRRTRWHGSGWSHVWLPAGSASRLTGSA
jgi:arginase